MEGNLPSFQVNNTGLITDQDKEIIEAISIPFNDMWHEKLETCERVEGRNNRKANDMSELKWLKKQLNEVWENE